MSYADRLSKLQGGYENADALKGSARSRPSDGDHHLRIDKALLEESKRGKLKGLLQVVWNMTVAAGPDAGKKCWKRTTLEGKNADIGLGVLKGDLETLGHKMKNIRALVGKNSVLQKVGGKVILARIATGNDPRFYNVYFNELVEEMPESEDIETADDEEFEAEADEIDLEEEVVEEAPKKKKKAAAEDEDDEEEDEEEDTDPDSWALDDVEAVEA